MVTRTGQAGGRVVVLGAGGIGQVALAALAQTADAESITIADLSADAATAAAGATDDPRVLATRIDVTDSSSLVRLLSPADVVLNCVGPFYRFGPAVLDAAIQSGTDLVDVCDDLDATRALLARDDAARAAGVTALIGMGNSPGLANLFVRMCADWFLDELHSAQIMHIHGGEPDEGAGVLKHRIHAMVADVPVFTGGRLKTVRMLEPDGQALVNEQDFAGVGRFPVYPYPHPETITLPRAFPKLREAGNFGVVFPLTYFQATQSLVAAGMASEDPLALPDGSAVAPIDVMVALLRARRPRLLAEAGITGPAGCLKVVASGLRAGEPHTYVAQVFSDADGAGAGTGIPAAIGTLLSLRGQLDGGPGVFAPEQIVPVAPVLELAGQIVSGLRVAGGAGLPIRLEHIGPDGTSEQIPFDLSSPAPG